MENKIYKLAMEFKPFEVEKEVKHLLSIGVDPNEILNSLRKAMFDACEKYGKEFALPQLSAIMASFYMGYEILKDKIKKIDKGRILIGILGSMHYIGKRYYKSIVYCRWF
jgi:methanogenic corrinoid protein MtbC1